jgi:hypothetical protein
MAEDLTNGVLDRETLLQELARIPSDGSSKIGIIRQAQRSPGETFIISI